MADSGNARVVYSTGTGRLCPECGAPVDACRCDAGPQEAVPARIVAKLRLEKKGRGGKAVTVVDNLPRNGPFLQGLAQELKRACGVGGAVGDGLVELQGDQRERLRDLLAKRGYTVKG